MQRLILTIGNMGYKYKGISSMTFNKSNSVKKLKIKKIEKKSNNVSQDLLVQSQVYKLQTQAYLDHRLSVQGLPSMFFLADLF